MALVAQMLSDALISGVVTVSPSAWYATPSFVSLGAFVLLTILAGWTCFAAQRTAPVPNSWSVKACKHARVCGRAARIGDI